MKINRYLAGCGLGSRRKCEELAASGRVRINGKTVVKLATEVSDDDYVTVDGKAVTIARTVTLMLHKPKGYICTNSDEKGRKTVFDLLDGKYKNVRLFCVGRLDYNTEGLLILTTDGILANKLTHPSAEIAKTYIAKTEKPLTEEELSAFSRGIMLDGTKTKNSSAVFVGQENGIYKYEVKITEGRNRQVRRMFEYFGKEVVFLKRTAIGELRLGGLGRGQYRELNSKEKEYIEKLK